MGSRENRLSIGDIAEAEAKREREIKYRLNVKEKVLETGQLTGRVFTVVAVTEEELHLREVGSGQSVDVTARHGDWDNCELTYSGTLIKELIDDAG